jgi:pyruvate/2-oxoglutarate/acetoin dehydrogenase E1 component/TPP-dependent pyruvate/acetoin dehydrogenase alpha subunit
MNAVLKAPTTEADLLGLYRTMLRIAESDRAVQRSLSAGELQFQYYPCGGQEAISAGVGAALRADDYMATTYRCIHDVVGKGTPLTDVFAELYGRAAGTCKGKGGPMHLSDPNSGLMITTGIVGAGLPIANGLALAEQLRGGTRVCVCNFGDGATSIGAFHEALNLAAVWKLPVVFVCQNNQYAEYTGLAEYTLTPDFSTRAAAYGMHGVRVDGTDPVAVHTAATAAVARARAGQGPTLLEAVCHRLQGHSFGSEETHMDAAALKQARADSPLSRFRKRLIGEHIASEAQLAQVESAVKAEVTAAMDRARALPPPPADELYSDVFADASLIPDRAIESAAPRAAGTYVASTSRAPMTFGQAVNEALAIALEADQSVFLLGEDIADPAGGVVKTTYGLSTRFGRDRVRPTPICEQAIVGAAIGAAMAGMKPVAEIMINDFLMVCMDQVSNHAAKLRYMSGGRTSVPLTIRTLTAGYVGSFGAQHSQTLEAWLAHTPGLKVVYPSTPAEAKGLLLSCIDDPDPCVFFESMRLYFSPGPVPEGSARIPLGSADVKRAGTDLTIVTYGWTVPDALAVADTLGKEGVSVEVLDLRSIVPLDVGALLASVEKTRRAVVLHAGVEFAGFGAEIASILHTRLHGKLAAPVARVGARYTPVPFAQSLEPLHFPGAERTLAAARRVLAR